MTSNASLMLYTELAGFRLIVLANRLGCDSDVCQELHDRLIHGLDAAIDQVRTIMWSGKFSPVTNLPLSNWRARSRYSDGSQSIFWMRSTSTTTRTNIASMGVAKPAPLPSMTRVSTSTIPSWFR